MKAMQLLKFRSSNPVRKVELQNIGRLPNLSGGDPCTSVTAEHTVIISPPSHKICFQILLGCITFTPIKEIMSIPLYLTR